MAIHDSKLRPARVQRTVHRINLLLLLLLLGALVSAALLSGCGSDEEPTQAAPVAGTRVENPELGIALASVPPPFVLDVNEGETLRLRRSEHAEGPPGTVTFDAGEEQIAGVNLPQAVEDQKARIEALPEGDYLGRLELGSQLGTAFSTRGRYLDEGEKVEEVRLFTVHPSGNRLFSMRYVYPLPTDSEARMEEAFLVLGEVEPFTAPGATGPEPGTDTAAPGEGEIEPEEPPVS